jgi:hypothetical protein
VVTLIKVTSSAFFVTDFKIRLAFVAAFSQSLH